MALLEWLYINFKLVIFSSFKKNNFSKGSILAFSLLILGVMFAVATSLSYVTISEVKDANSTELSSQAYQAADSGVQSAIKIINTQIAANKGTDNISVDFPNCLYPDADGSINGADYKLNFYGNSSGVGATLNCNTAKLIDIKGIKSTGSFKGTVRAVIVAVNVHPCGGQSILPDSRDGKNYNIIEIGTQCWMAQNINVGTKAIKGSNSAQGTDCSSAANIQKWCWGNLDSNCSSWGGLYQWQQVMCGTSTEGVQGICPNGWHVPTDLDWDTLEIFLGMPPANVNFAGEEGIAQNVGTQLKVGGTSGFNAIIAGYTWWDGFGETPTPLTARFWTSTKRDAQNAYNRELFKNSAGIQRDFATSNGGNGAGYSIRCIKN